jgi:Rieske Fe-S protein
MTDFKKINRREFLGIATGALSGLIGLLMGIPAIAYIVGPALAKDNSQSWKRLGSTAKVEVGTPTLFKITIDHTVGWIEEEQEHSIYILTENGRDFIAMSNICTHLGCRARWISDNQQFYCPCHVGIFDKQGYVVAGPPPRPLDRYEVKVEDGQLYIGQLYEIES